MPASQQSFEARLERFILGNGLVQSWLDYDPQNVLIKKLSLTGFILSVNTANTLCNNTRQTLGNGQTARAPLVFTNKETNPACLQKRIEQIVPYLEGDLGKTSPSAKLVRSVRLKIRPVYPKKPPGTPRGAGNSPMERSFASAVGLGQKVVDCIFGLGAAYKPANPDLSVASMQALVNLIKDKNKIVTEALEPFGNANRARRKLYDQDDGMKERIVSIKGYLASFQGGKKSDRYIEYSQAIKGS